jgi:hypothetical protein
MKYKTAHRKTKKKQRHKNLLSEKNAAANNKLCICNEYVHVASMDIQMLKNYDTSCIGITVIVTKGRIFNFKRKI